MRNRNNKLYVSCAFAPHLLFSNFNTATIANNPLITNTFIFSAMAFEILYRTEDLLTKETIAFGLIGSVIYRFWTHHFAT